MTHKYVYIYISFEILDQKALEDFNDIFPLTEKTQSPKM